MNKELHAITRTAALLAVVVPCLAWADSMASLNDSAKTSRAAGAAPTAESAHGGASRFDGVVSPDPAQVSAGPSGASASALPASSGASLTHESRSQIPAPENDQTQHGNRFSASAGMPWGTAKRYMGALDHFIIGERRNSCGDLFGMICGMADDITDAAKRVVCSPLYLVAGAAGLVAGAGAGLLNLFTGKQKS